MNAKELLEQIKKIDTQIQNKKYEYQQWLDQAYNITPSGESVAIKNKKGKTELHNMEKVKSSPVSLQRMSDAVINYVDIENQIAADIKELATKKREIIKLIEQLPEAEYDVLHKIYVQYKEFQDVADERGKSYSWATSIHGKALVMLDEIIKRQGVTV